MGKEVVRGREITKEQKDLIIKSMHGEPKVIHLLSGGLWRLPEGKIRITKIGDGELDYGYKYGLLDGIYPMLATVELAKLFPGTHILTTGHSTTTGQSHAKIYADALIKQGVLSSRILQDESPIGTLGELRTMVEHTVENNWQGPIALVVNDWHKERALELFARLGQFVIPEDPSFARTLEEFTARNVQVLFAEAEELFGIIHPKFKDYYAKVKETEPYKILAEVRMKSEESGVASAKKGNY